MTKPACLTVKLDRLRILAKAPDDALLDRIEKQCGIVIFTFFEAFTPTRKSWTHRDIIDAEIVEDGVRLTFIDDVHAAEFALRYA